MTGPVTIASAIIDCIREGRIPRADELCEVANRISSDLQGMPSTFPWGDLNADSLDPSPAMKLAQAALTGVACGVRARREAPVTVPITRKDMEMIDAPNHFHSGNGAELVKRAGSKALSGWGRADQVLPDL